MLPQLFQHLQQHLQQFLLLPQLKQHIMQHLFLLNFTLYTMGQTDKL